MADLGMTAAVMVDAIEAFTELVGPSNATALQYLNDGLRRFARGVYRDERGTRLTHSWSFKKEINTLPLVDGTGDYALPSDFGGLIDDFTYQYLSGGKVGDISRKSPEFIYDYRSRTETTGRAEYFTIIPVDFVTATGQRWQVMFAPTPDANQTIYYRYRVLISALTDGAVYPPGGADFSDVVLQAGLARAEFLGGKVNGPMEAMYLEMMADAVSFDKAQLSPGFQIQTMADVRIK